jgi:hypothetical protein
VYVPCQDKLKIPGISLRFGSGVISNYVASGPIRIEILKILKLSQGIINSL